MNNKKTYKNSARLTSIRNRILGADFVNSLDDDAVCNMINFDFNIKMYDVDQAIRGRDITLTTCRPYNNGDHPCTNTNRCKGHWHMTQMRDLLILLITKRI